VSLPLFRSQVPLHRWLYYSYSYIFRIRDRLRRSCVSLLSFAVKWPPVRTHPLPERTLSAWETPVANATTPCIGLTLHTVAHIPRSTIEVACLSFGLHKISIHFEAFVHESTICLLPSFTCIARTTALLLHGYCPICAPTTTPLVYAIHLTRLVMAISCKGELGFYTILPSEILYGIWHRRGRSAGARILRNGRAIVLQ